MFTLLVVLCIVACVALALVGMIGGGTGSEEVTKERMARREERAAAPATVTPLPSASDSPPARGDAAA